MMFSRSFAVHAGSVSRGQLQTLHRIQNGFQIWAIERAVSLSAAGDLRWMIAAVAASILAALEAMIQRQLAMLVRHIMGRALQGAHFAGAARTADSMVAAGGR
ncbi:MAG: hypothetical protein JOZ74_14110 [Bradyrhizobium sp.]|nr:hypothetical protein [Bradyrhizobium sp.]